LEDAAAPRCAARKEFLGDDGGGIWYGTKRKITFLWHRNFLFSVLGTKPRAEVYDTCISKKEEEEDKKE
jgi:hypothetical protein